MKTSKKERKVPRERAESKIISTSYEEQALYEEMEDLEDLGVPIEKLEEAQAEMEEAQREIAIQLWRSYESVETKAEETEETKEAENVKPILATSQDR